MPNRLIKDSIHESEKISMLTDFQFRVWVNLITYVDDYGRGDARPAIIKGRCFPLRDDITADLIGDTLVQLADIGCIGLYQIDGKDYLYFPKWDTHQRIRQKVSRCPEPDDPRAVMWQPAASGGESPQVAATCGDMQRVVSLNPNPNPNTNTNTEYEEVVVVGRAREEEDPMWAEYIREYSNNIGLVPTSEVEREDLKMFYDEFGTDAIREFIHYTARKHPDNPHRYFSQLCRKYLGKGINTPEMARAAINEHERKKGGRNGVTRSRVIQSAEYKPLFDGETVL